MRGQEPAAKRSWKVARFPIASVVAAAAMVAAASVGSAASGWKVVSSPDRGSRGDPIAVSCVSSTSCVAVGEYVTDSNVEQALAQSWNGTVWTTLPNPNAGAGTALEGVSCTSSASCMAVGGVNSSPFAERWNGTAWSVISTPTEGAQGGFSAVSCMSPTSCMAVGLYAASLSGVQRTMAERWNGSSWTIVATPNQGNGNNSLNSVSCTSSTSCVAVGEGPVGGATLVETWNGTSWAITPSPNPSGGEIFLNGVSCTSPTSCVAVGYYGYGYGSNPEQTLVESWNGSIWSIISSPNPSNSNDQLNAVSCTNSTRCMAVGSSASLSSFNGQTLVESWNGTTWTIVSSPSTGGNSRLAAISCISSKSCMAIGGEIFSNVGDSEALDESWNGNVWTIVPSPIPGDQDSLAAVSCTSTSSCVAVGGYNPQPAEAALIEIWSGGSWLPVYGETDGRAASLNGVSCFSSTDCLAVGSDANPSGVPQTLVDSWSASTGKSYAPRIASPNRGSESVLTAVSCVSSTACEAVGYYLTSSGTQRTLIESWDGTAWSIVPSPNETTEGNELNSVSCTSGNSCVAVGKYGYGPTDTAQAMVESWNGSVWSIIATPERGTQSVFNGVSCTSATRCVAVGDDNAPGGTLIESWNGTAWSVSLSPGGGTLNGVSCPTSTRCAAVGTSATSEELIESWNGTVWSVVPSTNQPGYSNLLFGVSCTSATSCTAAGDFEDAALSQTLVETGPA